MKQAYDRRPSDFRRRVLKRDIPRENILEEEQRWLNMVSRDELGRRYYNLNGNCLYHWHNDPDKRLSVGQKISKANKGRVGPMKGIPCSEDRKQKLSDLHRGVPKNYTRSVETRLKISQNNKRLQAEGKIGMRGRTHSDDTKRLMSENNAMNDPINRQKVSDAKKGIRWLTNGVTKKMAVPGTDKFDSLIDIGFKVI